MMMYEVYGPCRPSGCLDMVAVEGQFTFTAERPQLSCAAFFMAEPNEVISVDYDSVDIDCKGGDFITVSSHSGVLSLPSHSRVLLFGPPWW